MLTCCPWCHFACCRPSDEELALAPFQYDHFPKLNSCLMTKYYRQSKRTTVSYDAATYKMSVRQNSLDVHCPTPQSFRSGSDSVDDLEMNQNDVSSKLTPRSTPRKRAGTFSNGVDGGGAPKFRSIHHSVAPSQRDKLQTATMDESYDRLLKEMVMAFNVNIDRLLKWGNRQSEHSPFRHRRIKTKSMDQTVSAFLHRVYEMWCSIFNHHAINRLSIHTVSPKRDFLSNLMVLDQLLSDGHFPTELIMRQMALIPAHCAMEHELLLMDRWMIRLRMTPLSAFCENAWKC